MGCTDSKPKKIIKQIPKPPVQPVVAPKPTLVIPPVVEPPKPEPIPSPPITKPPSIIVNNPENNVVDESKQEVVAVDRTEYLRPEQPSIPPPRDHWPEDEATPIKQLIPIEVPRKLQGEATIHFDPVKPDLINERKPIGQAFESRPISAIPAGPYFNLQYSDASALAWAKDVSSEDYNETTRELISLPRLRVEIF